MNQPSKDPAEQKLQESLDRAYIQGKLPRKKKVKRETQTIFSVKND